MRTLFSWILSAGLVAMDAKAAELLLRNWFGVSGIGLHLLACFISFLLIKTFVPESEPKRMKVVLFLLPLMILLPVFGIAFACGTLLLSGPSRGAMKSGCSYVSLGELLPEGGVDSYAYGSTISSIAEIMRSTDVNRRRQATLSLRSLKPIDSLPILRRLTQDDDEIVRLFALGERRRITNDFEERSRRLAKIRLSKKASVSDLLRLAECYLEEVEIGLPADEVQRKALLQKTLDVLWEARRLDPERIDIEFDILRSALAAYDSDVAERAFHRLKSVRGLRDRLIIPQCEFYFMTGNWKSLADELFCLPDSYRQSPHMERIVELWQPAIRRLAGSNV